MLKERVATIECFENKTKTFYYLNRYDADSWLYGFWLYTIENKNGQTVKAFEVEPVPPNVYNVEKMEIEKYLKQIENHASCLILYEVEYIYKNQLEKQIGFQTLQEWYEEFLKYVNKETLKLLSEDFVKGFWVVYEKFYRDNKDFRKLLFNERYILSNMFSSVLGYVKQVIDNGKPKDYIERLYGNEFVDWLVDVVNRFYSSV
jgi:hypothetical protein